MRRWRCAVKEMKKIKALDYNSLKKKKGWKGRNFVRKGLRVKLSPPESQQSREPSPTSGCPCDSKSVPSVCVNVSANVWVCTYFSGRRSETYSFVQRSHQQQDLGFLASGACSRGTFRANELPCSFPRWFSNALLALQQRGAWPGYFQWVVDNLVIAFMAHKKRGKKLAVTLKGVNLKIKYSLSLASQTYWASY